MKAALYRRHAAVAPNTGGPGPWTCTEEWAGIDFLAFSAWSQPHPARARYSRVGYEVKVSRGDYRSEVLNPRKRAHAVAFCHEFYFAIPAGLLKPDEVAYAEPEWEDGDFARTPCRFAYCGSDTPAWNDDPGICHSGLRETTLVGPLQRGYAYRPHVRVKCQGCDGRGYAAKSRVEQEAPTLWVPADVGLIEVGGNGAHVVRRAPLRRDPTGIRNDQELHQLVRWMSWRPDPRHVADRDARAARAAGLAAPVDETTDAV